jgi:hypothetical protein
MHAAESTSESISKFLIFSQRTSRNHAPFRNVAFKASTPWRISPKRAAKIATKRSALGKELEVDGKPEEAKAQYRMALEVDPNCVEARNSLRALEYVGVNAYAQVEASEIPKAGNPTELKPIDFDSQSSVEGLETQVLSIDLEPNQLLTAETGNLLFMTDGVAMAASSGGGIAAMLARKVTGQNLFVSNFTLLGSTKGTVVLGAAFPAKILRVNLARFGGALVCQKVQLYDSTE